MYGWEERVLLRHYLEQGLTITAIAERVARALRSDQPATTSVPSKTSGRDGGRLTSRRGRVSANSRRTV